LSKKTSQLKTFGGIFLTVSHVFSIINCITTVCLLFSVNNYLFIKEKEVINFSNHKTKDGWCSDNFLAAEEKIIGQCGIEKKYHCWVVMK